MKNFIEVNGIDGYKRLINIHYIHVINRNIEHETNSVISFAAVPSNGKVPFRVLHVKETYEELKELIQDAL